MDDNKEQEKFTTYLLVPDEIAPDLSASEWIQSATVKVAQTETLLRLLFQDLLAKAPLLLRDPVVMMLMEGIGSTLDKMNKSGEEWLRGASVPVLTKQAEILRVAREKLDRPGLPQEVRDELYAMIVHAVEGTEGDDGEWPTVIGGVQ